MGGYDFGVSFSGSSSAGANNSGATDARGGGVNFIINDGSGSASGSSSQKALLTWVGILIGSILVGFVAWRLVK